MPLNQQDLKELVIAAEAMNSAFTVVFLVNPQESTPQELRVAWPETCQSCIDWFDFPGDAIETAIPLGMETCCAESFPKIGFQIKKEFSAIIDMLRSHLAERSSEPGPSATAIIPEQDEVCASDSESYSAEITAETAVDAAADASAASEVTAAVGDELSGPQWVQRFPTSRSIFDLKPPFLAKMTAFYNALTTAGARVSITATLRPAERAFLMHWSYKIANQGQNPQTVPRMAGVNINWWHGNSVSSRNAARQMVEGYGIAFPPALNSIHIQGWAIDMGVSWDGTLQIKDGTGATRSIGAPRAGSNTALHQVGRTYGVIKLPSDPPHWSVNGH